MNRLILTALALLLLSPELFSTDFRTLVIPVEFSDVAFSDHKKNVEEIVTKAEKYFNGQFISYKSFGFELLPTVKLSKEQSWYGANSTSQKDERADQLVKEACALTGRDPGSWDQVCIITAGKSEADGAGADCIWPQYVEGVSICPEESGLSVFCHEFAHSLGLQDLYDTDGSSSGGTASGISGYSLMDGGILGSADNPPCFCAIELDQLGIGTRIELKEGALKLRPVSNSREYLRIPSDKEGEFFLLECRSNKGLVAYHIDRSSNDSGWSDLYNRNLSASERWQYNQVNCCPDHQCAEVISVDALVSWSGAVPKLAVDGITYSQDGSADFKLITPINSMEITPFQDAVIISWGTDSSLSVKECMVSLQQEGDPGLINTKVQPQANGKYYAIVERLLPATSYSVIIKAFCTDGSVHSASGSFTTKNFQKGMRPFIYLRLTDRNADCSFPAGARIPLRVYNAQDVQNVRWYFNETHINPDSDGFWHVSTGGILKAKVWYTDGSTDVIVKIIKVK